MGDDTTTIEVTNETWSELNSRKEGPSDSFNEVIQRLLEDSSNS